MADAGAPGSRLAQRDGLLVGSSAAADGGRVRTSLPGSGWGPTMCPGRMWNGVAGPPIDSGHRPTRIATGTWARSATEDASPDYNSDAKGDRLSSGSSRIANSAYQKWPTWSSRFRGTAQQSSRAVLPNPIPFRSTRQRRYQTGSPRPLGSINPCASAVHMEPFPSSAFKVLI
ncbi:hypothetical protein PIB30_066501 [Stylosanthes scabra]|uniref:Uncharacterized protein n=1 Tax=Stylosanthes scabra TaxID=79078 RepID=A0ABU6UQ76_9FABA|nr:hypothetical protein [Stylosanthes scabra]